MKSLIRKSFSTQHDFAVVVDIVRGVQKRHVWLEREAQVAVKPDVEGPRFDFHVIDSPQTWASYLTLRSLADASVDPWTLDGIDVNRATRDAILVWWDQHAHEYEPLQQLFDAGRKAGLRASGDDLDLAYQAREDRRPAGELAEAEVRASNFFWHADEPAPPRRREAGGSFYEEAFDLSVDLDVEPEVGVAAFRSGFVRAWQEIIEEERYLRPSNYEVGQRLLAAGLPNAPQRSGGADWSVQAWALGNRYYLVEDEGHDVKRKDGYHRAFSIVQRVEGGDEEVLEPHPLDAAIDFWKRQHGGRHR